MGRCLILVLAALLTIPVATDAQIGRLRDRGRLEAARRLLSRFLEGEDPISTSSVNVLVDVPMLDDYEPDDALPLASLPAGPGGGFLVHSGLFEMEVESFCLRAGTYAPGGGEGYLHAHLDGPMAGTVERIIGGSAEHLEVAQKDVQLLLWAILARARIEELPPELQRTAAKLLPPEDLARINRNGLDLVPDNVRDLARRELPEPVLKVFEIRARMRELLTDASTTFEEIERTAVLVGDPPEDEGGRIIPKVRWTYDPDGYFVRYQPRSYKRTRIQVEFPMLHELQRDDLGRIVGISDEYGNRIEVDYDDDAAPTTVSDNTGLRAFALRAVRFISPDTTGPGAPSVVEVLNPGWTLSGSTTGPVSDAAPSAFPGFGVRHAQARRAQDNLAKLAGGAADPSPDASLDDVMDLAHLKMALSQADADPETRAGVARVTKAWQFALCLHMNGCGGAGGSPRLSSALSRGRAPSGPPMGRPARALPSVEFDQVVSGPWAGEGGAGRLLAPLLAAADDAWSQSGGCGNNFQPAGGVAVPGSSKRQRLGIGTRPAEGEAEAEGSVPKAVGTITHREGRIAVRRDGRFVRLRKGDAIAPGEVFRTYGKSRAEITLSDGSVVRVGTRSEIQMPETASALDCGPQPKPGEGERPVTLKLLLGKAWFKVTSTFGGGATYEVTTGNAVLGVRGTSFIVEAVEDPTYTTTVGVCEGEVEVTNTGGPVQETIVLGPGQMTRVVGDAVPEEPSAFECSPRWIDWVQAGAPKFTTG